MVPLRIRTGIKIRNDVHGRQLDTIACHTGCNVWESKAVLVKKALLASTPSGNVSGSFPLYTYIRKHVESDTALLY